MSVIDCSDGTRAHGHVAASVCDKEVYFVVFNLSNSVRQTQPFSEYKYIIAVFCRRIINDRLALCRAAESL